MLPKDEGGVDDVSRKRRTFLATTDDASPRECSSKFVFFFSIKVHDDDVIIAFRFDDDDAEDSCRRRWEKKCCCFGVVVDANTFKKARLRRLPRPVFGLRNFGLLATLATGRKKRQNRVEKESVSRDGPVECTLGSDRNDGGVSTGESGRRFRSEDTVNRDRTESENTLGDIEQREKSRTRRDNADERENDDEEEEDVLVVAVSF